ncbi:MAG: hypothetical protein RLN90_00915 [Balneolaceae bacterium]
MGKTSNRIKPIITPILIFNGLVIVILIYTILRDTIIKPDPSMGLGVLFGFIGLFISVVVLIFEQVFVMFIRREQTLDKKTVRTIWIIEFLIISFILFFLRNGIG